jgi:hypothetical protein
MCFKFATILIQNAQLATLKLGKRKQKARTRRARIIQLLRSS